MKRKMRKEMRLCTSVLAFAWLALLGACSENDNLPVTPPAGGIGIVPSVSTDALQSGAVTRADETTTVSIDTGGELCVVLMEWDEAQAQPVAASKQQNRFAMTAQGKLERIAYDNEKGDTRQDLNVPAAGKYYFQVTGSLNLKIGPNSVMKSFVALRNSDTEGNTDAGYLRAVSDQGVVALDTKIVSSAIGVTLRDATIAGTVADSYTGNDVTVTLQNITDYNTGTPEVKVLTADAPAHTWGDLAVTTKYTEGQEVMHLAVDSKTYKVLAPREMTMSAGRCYNYTVMVGATEITVSSDDLTVGDFVVQPETNVEAEVGTPLYNGQPSILLSVPDGTPYWVAPEDAAIDVRWGDVNFTTVCPSGWHVPSKDDFVAMTGLPADDKYHETNHAAIKAAFPADYHYWLPLEYELDPASYAWSLSVRGADGTAGVKWFNKTITGRVRCVRIKG